MISYKPFFKTLIDKDLEKKDLVNSKVISKSTMTRINNGDFVALQIIDKLCEHLECNVSDIIEYKAKSKES
ncbi:DNA-binding Xre family transcriptional regulator [Clostridium acetobutylicum]|uniref:HTH cro/C1-type domain-containing protein n=1 Tax=Clostridium acetobutylicum (strain ATCC 824 / DSM 792 / JCM 1419 / IAM 19013 / LMG 5710 / NBRC 13948 / NRRL B-527 / VKM B-1787 / 2291 / W) TaxID=272562 RepID=Q97HQ8_CLOAB|nr:MULTISPECIES: helix-turn-helix transcriptional regulator [Clostridium]AAK79912.1 Hypothetical protein CA_C1950 [Clostridium acetobutylicum ATCC 824]ADZ21004.1 Conserved hypothetical protein [Clostridium acetobutylicum EA 2018]AEI32089.1 hypothetical protein SMB_G1981 [Clostridium acetobutylicum DSM 1731]AWV79655.1 transcriptional regulator [Clostridium acetobutylicum]MBC2394370.1 helix-turn-helix transcriptional regulator [Clostridium acetobutylicum]